jgi:hypothetical protein
MCAGRMRRGRKEVETIDSMVSRRKKRRRWAFGIQDSDIKYDSGNNSAVGLAVGTVGLSSSLQKI